MSGRYEHQNVGGKVQVSDVVLCYWIITAAWWHQLQDRYVDDMVQLSGNF